MKVRAEVSKWEDSFMQNGVYLTNDNGDKMYGFAKHGSHEFKYFKNPIMINLRYRKFIDLFKFDIEEDEDLGKKVIGSRGDVYYVRDGMCTCAGFKYRGECKHV